MSLTCKDKTDLIAHLVTKIEAQIAVFQSQLDSLNSTIASESKSSAGDKFETAREMANQEINRIATQINLLTAHFRTLQKIDDQPKTNIAVGTLFGSKEKTYFVAIAFGKTLFKDKEIMVVSAQSPFGQAAMGKAKGDNILLNGNKIKIEWLV